MQRKSSIHYICHYHSGYFNNTQSGFAAGHIELQVTSGVCLGVRNMAEDIKTEIKNHQTALSDTTSPTRAIPKLLTKLPGLSPLWERNDCWRGWHLHMQMVQACAQVPWHHILAVGLGWLPGRRHVPCEDLNWLHPTWPLSSILLLGRWRGSGYILP